ncbi:MAG: class I SAM-dependent methyltransferase [Chloroflexota bacterium]|nr:class I SAM-dependent methyltransferase [Chloroflexota bacterium]
MPFIATQFLEYEPDISSLPEASVRRILRQALNCLPIDILIIGWDLPDSLINACAEESARTGTRLYLWHPLLTGSANFPIKKEWRTIGLAGEPVPGYRNLPEFTFLCPNRTDTADAMLENLGRALARGPFDGLFLDRIRFPSPAEDPGRYLACFCQGCQRTAAVEGLHLGEVRSATRSLLSSKEGRRRLLRLLLDCTPSDSQDERATAVQRFMLFRSRVISRFIESAASQARQAGFSIGLDCFSPCLAPMVGQDLSVLGRSNGWVKLMTYGHAMGPAGIPFELINLANCLVDNGDTSEQEALAWLAEETALDLPATIETFRDRGLPPQSLAKEIRRAHRLGVRTAYAGIELLDAPGIADLNNQQIQTDLDAFLDAGADGLVLSWDLLKIPEERLKLVADVVFARTCPLCSSDSAELYHNDRWRPYYRCNTCSLVFVPPAFHLSAEKEKAQYNLHENSPDDPGYRRFLSRLFLPMQERLPAGSHGLDFGSGPGPALPLMFEEAGHLVSTYDPFFADDPRLLQQHYDFITASEVVEHLSHPGEVLEQLWQCVRPGGTLGIMTKLVIDREAFASWHYIRDLTHISFFSLDTLQWLAEKWHATIEVVDRDVILFQQAV